VTQSKEFAKSQKTRVASYSKESALRVMESAMVWRSREQKLTELVEKHSTTFKLTKKVHPPPDISFGASWPRISPARFGPI